jgi:hypothetical protein
MYRLEDILIVEHVLECVHDPAETEAHPGRLTAEVGKYFLGTPYTGGTLERKGAEELTANLQTFDCFTFVESCLALTLLILHRRRTWNDFTALLQKARYRDGKIDGYASRLHYFSDWLADNVRKGILRDMAPELGGVALKKGIRYMTGHAGAYPSLSDPETLRQMEEVEHGLTEQPPCFLPTATLEQREHRIQEGDILGITTEEEGLDVMHAGLAVYRGEALHLLHASQQAGKVLISEETLGEYLRSNAKRTGVLVGRIKAQ